MGLIERKGGASWADRHPHEPQIKRQIDAKGRCLVCGLMEETRSASVGLALRAAESAIDAALKSIRILATFRQ